MLVTSISTGSMVGKRQGDLLRTKLQIERSTQASPSDVMSHPLYQQTTNSDTTSNINDEVEKPFFIMDWLDQVDPTAIEIAQKLLSRPTGTFVQKNVLSSIKKDTEVPTVAVTPSTSLHDLKKDTLAKPKSSASSHFLRRSIEVGNGYNAKGIDYARLGQWEDALKAWNSALDIRTQIYTPTHVDVANTCNNVGIALGKLHRYPEAIASLQRALEIRIQHNGGPEHAQVAATLHNIGNVYQQTGELESAIAYFCQCKLLQETIFGGSDHSEVARSCIAIGHTYFQGEALLDAREAYADALAIFHRVGVPKHNPEVLATECDIRDLDKKIALQSHCRNY